MDLRPAGRPDRTLDEATQVIRVLNVLDEERRGLRVAALSFS